MADYVSSCCGAPVQTKFKCYLCRKCNSVCGRRKVGLDPEVMKRLKARAFMRRNSG